MKNRQYFESLMGKLRVSASATTSSSSRWCLVLEVSTKATLFRNLTHLIEMFITKYIALLTALQVGTSTLLNTNVVVTDSGTPSTEDADISYFKGAPRAYQRRISEAIRSVPRKVEVPDGDCASLGGAVTAASATNPFWCVCASDGTAKCSTGKTCGSEMCWNAQNVYQTHDNVTYSIQTAFVCLLTRTEEVDETSTKAPLISYCFQLMYPHSADETALVNCTGFFEGYCNSCQPCSTSDSNNVLMDSFQLECSNTGYGPKASGCVNLDSLIDEYGASGSSTSGVSHSPSWGIPVCLATFGLMLAALYI